MLEAAKVSILAKAIDFLFEQGRLILQERRERRVAAQKQPPAPATDLAPVPAPDDQLLSSQLSKTEALHTPILLTTWSIREAEVKHLVALLEIEARNYWLAKEQYARWGSALVPPVIVSNLEEAENSVADTTTRLSSILGELYKDKTEAAPRVAA